MALKMSNKVDVIFVFFFFIGCIVYIPYTYLLYIYGSPKVCGGIKII